MYAFLIDLTRVTCPAPLILLILVILITAGTDTSILLNTENTGKISLPSRQIIFLVSENLIVANRTVFDFVISYPLFKLLYYGDSVSRVCMWFFIIGSRTLTRQRAMGIISRDRKLRAFSYTKNAL